jgi:hypothetical protein
LIARSARADRAVEPAYFVVARDESHVPSLRIIHCSLRLLRLALVCRCLPHSLVHHCGVGDLGWVVDAPVVSSGHCLPHLTQFDVRSEICGTWRLPRTCDRRQGCAPFERRSVSEPASVLAPVTGASPLGLAARRLT